MASRPDNFRWNYSMSALNGVFMHVSFAILNATTVIPVFLSMIYGVYICLTISTSGLDFGSLESVKALFSHDHAVLAGWVHYLAFDLLVGMWMLEENLQLKLPPWMMLPCLMATFMLGPIGFVLFVLLRTIKN